MNLSIDIEVASDGDEVPDPHSISDWLQSVVRNQSVLRQCKLRMPVLFNDRKIISDTPEITNEIELSVCIVDRQQIQQLNATYRHKDSPTNVLSFPSDLPTDVPVRHLGDIVICASVVNEEAQQQNKSADAHWAHMAVHGLLHLLGYDHESEDDAEEMEATETEILLSLKFPAPYAVVSAEMIDGDSDTVARLTHN